jgi:hypothetical protein
VRTPQVSARETSSKIIFQLAVGRQALRGLFEEVWFAHRARDFTSVADFVSYQYLQRRVAGQGRASFGRTQAGKPFATSLRHGIRRIARKTSLPRSIGRASWVPCLRSETASMFVVGSRPNMPTTSVGMAPILRHSLPVDVEADRHAVDEYALPVAGHVYAQIGKVVGRQRVRPRNSVHPEPGPARAERNGAGDLIFGFQP